MALRPEIAARSYRRGVEERLEPSDHPAVDQMASPSPPPFSSAEAAQLGDVFSLPPSHLRNSPTSLFSECRLSARQIDSPLVRGTSFKGGEADFPLQWNDRIGADSGPSRDSLGRGAIRAFETVALRSATDRPRPKARVPVGSQQRKRCAHSGYSLSGRSWLNREKADIG
jgi:hypothetical protein